jgi:hypothetical protein
VRALQQESVHVLDCLSTLTRAKAATWDARFPTFETIKAEGDFRSELLTR